MALIVADRVMETSTTTGTGAFTLAAAVTGHRRFSAVCSTSDTCYYTIVAVDSNGNPSGDWETGLGTYSSANTLTRTTPAASTNGGAAVNFGAGTKYVFITATAGYLGTAYSSGGTDVALADGGTGASLADPNADRIMFWDDSAGAVTWLQPGTNLSITGTTLNATGGSSTPWDFSPPTAASFSLQNSDGVNLTLSDDANLGLIVDAGALASNTWRYAYRTLTTPASAWDMIVKFPFFAANNNYGAGGVFAHNSTSGRLIQMYSQNSAPLVVSKFSGLGSYSSDVANPGSFAPQTVQWFRISSNGTTISFHVGFGPNCWVQIFSESLATYLNSSGSTNRVGFFYRVNGTWKMIGHIPYFSLTGPGV